MSFKYLKDMHATGHHVFEKLHALMCM
jgi:hypothetical protein